jgi:hypothetical protein
MEFIDWVTWACLFIAGYATRGAIDDARYPKPKHRWQCPHCPLRIGASDPEFLRAEAEKHHAKQHPGVHS